MTAVLLDELSSESAPRARRRVHGTSWSDHLIDDSVDYLDGAEGLRLRLRSAADGPEQVLVEAFLEAATLKLRRGCTLTVFAQPAIETGFPDLVAVVWRSSVARTWRTERERLRGGDLRLLHMLATGGPLEITFLQHLFHRGLSGMLGRLEDAGVVVVGQSSCRARSLSKVFAVEQIIAVEAKVSAHKRLLEQAAANSWFSSESYALLPNIRAGARICGAAAAKGVGVIALEHGVAAQVNAAFVRGVPLSYGSWLFNEWTWRLARLQGTI